MRRYLYSCIFLLLACFIGAYSPKVKAQPTTIPDSAAAQVFLQANKLCSADHGKIWGVSLCGPMMFVSRKSHSAVLNESVQGATHVGNIWRIDLPKDFPYANSAVSFKGQRWTMIMWRSIVILKKKSKNLVGIVLMHESFHRIQPIIGLPQSGARAANNHLNTKKGRIWLRGELNALRAALKSHGKKRKQALKDALIMRVYRQTLWPYEAQREQALELNEGLAQSTANEAVFHTRKARIQAAVDKINKIEDRKSYVRTFAYATGPAYGILLNIGDPGWRRDVTKTFVFGKAAANAYNIPMPKPTKTDAMEALQRHGGKHIIAQEKQRANKISARNKRYQKEFSGLTITFPIIQSSRTFNPRKITNFKGHGKIYGILHDSDVWGELKVKGGDALLLAKQSVIILPITHKPSGPKLQGDGWSATLNEGWTVKPNPHKEGSYIIEKDTDVQM